MIRKKQITFSIGLIILGWILNAIAWTVAGPHPTNTIFLVAGVSGFIGGLIWLLIALISK
tara:strand:+ start:2312 stop:2491 length:180 start_codon:yes stop_codon:yes gene_type:complete